MKLLIDEQTPVQYRDVLAFLLPGHDVTHVNDLRWKSKKDVALLADAVTRGFEVFLTNDVRQLDDPAETDAIRRSGIHHVRYRGPPCKSDRAGPPRSCPGCRGGGHAHGHGRTRHS